MKQAVLGYEQQFYVDGTQISGVQSVNGSYAISEKPINILGYGHVNDGFNAFGPGINDLDTSLFSREILDESLIGINDNNSEGIYTDGKDIYNEVPGEDFDFRRNSAFAISSEDGFLAQPYKSMAVINSPLQGSFSINSILISEDFMFKYIGDNPFAGSIHHGDKFFGFYNGYVNSHSVSCSVGSLPIVNTSITVFGDIGGDPDYFVIKDENEEDGFLKSEDGLSLATEATIGDRSLSAKGNKEFPDIKITDHKSISLKIGGAEIDRVMSFNHSMRAGLRPIYKIGSPEPVQVDLVWPITSQTQFSIEVDEYEYKRLRRYLISPTLHDLAIKIHDCTGTKIQHYTVIQARLISESISASVNGRLTVNLSYNSYYNKRR